MTAAPIAYDLPVKNLIAGLDATGHVTNTAYRKTSVTFHHNGGRLSHEGVLEVWKTREASAQFDVDGAGDVAQYTGVNMYAWATGNTEGNKSSISIEMADATLAPEYTIAEVTWKSAARLAGWLFARVIGAAPTRDTVHLHHDWTATTCAGPFMDSIREQLFQEVLAAYNAFAGTSVPAQSSAPAGLLPLDQIARQVIAGSWDSGDNRRRKLANAGYNPDEVQAEVNRQLGRAPAPVQKSMDQVVNEVLAGKYGNGPQRSAALSAAGYSPAEVQAAVNARLGQHPSTNVTARPSITALATQVIAGQWGNGAERERRLSQAGFDYAAIRAEVNRRLG